VGTSEQVIDMNGTTSTTLADYPYITKSTYTQLIDPNMHHYNHNNNSTPLSAVPSNGCTDTARRRLGPTGSSSSSPGSHVLVADDSGYLDAAVGVVDATSPGRAATCPLHTRAPLAATDEAASVTGGDATATAEQLCRMPLKETAL
jgi:hypothetical protein